MKCEKSYERESQCKGTPRRPHSMHATVGGVLRLALSRSCPNALR